MTWQVGGAPARELRRIVVVVLAAGLALAGCSSRGSMTLGQGTATGQQGAGATGGKAAGGSASTGRHVVANPLPSWAKRAVSHEPAARIEAISRVAHTSVAAVVVFRATGDASPWMTLKNPQPPAAPLVFLVQEQRGRWLRAVPVGLGTATTPTPGGVYFTEKLLKPTNPNGPYGPYAYGLSGFSPVLNEFMGGNGQIGIHGTNDPAGIGKNVSHGCIRMSNPAIARLATMLPLGVPVQITT
jgi:lipoprotein-anchoring transpeptidase ErfK/SrfK